MVICGGYEFLQYSMSLGTLVWKCVWLLAILRSPSQRRRIHVAMDKVAGGDWGVPGSHYDYGGFFVSWRYRRRGSGSELLANEGVTIWLYMIWLCIHTIMHVIGYLCAMIWKCVGFFIIIRSSSLRRHIHVIMDMIKGKDWYVFKSHYDNNGCVNTAIWNNCITNDTFNTSRRRVLTEIVFLLVPRHSVISSLACSQRQTKTTLSCCRGAPVEPLKDGNRGVHMCYEACVVNELWNPNYGYPIVLWFVSHCHVFYMRWHIKRLITACSQTFWNSEHCE